MQRLRVRGLVRLADLTRKKLAHPIAPEELARLRRTVADGIRMVEELAAQQGCKASALPAPSRKAYVYLSGIDWTSIRAVETPGGPEHLPASIRFKGLQSYFRSLLDDLAGLNGPSDLAKVYAEVKETSAELAGYMKKYRYSPKHLKPESRDMMIWFAYFQDRDNFDAYTAALRTAQPALEAGVQQSRRFAAPAIVHFRPMKGLYRIRGYEDGTHVHLITPLISFDREAFADLAEFMFSGKGNRQALMERTDGAAYRAVHDELERLAGDADQTAGAFHDLAASFERVRASYFAGEMARPRLSWSRHVTGRKFGHYNHIHDAVMVSCTLDSPQVPVYVVDFVVYHELLHKKHGGRWRNGRQAFHTPEFRRAEKQFEQYAAAEAALNRLARRYS